MDSGKFVLCISLADTDSSQLIGEATAIAYKGATLDLQGRIRRVVVVWRDRQIFDPAVQMDIESRLDQIDQTRGSGRKAQLGGTLSSSSQPPMASELQPLFGHHTSLTRAETQAGSAPTALAEDDKLKTSEAAKLTLPVQANRLGAVIKQLANAEGAVAEKVKARKSLLADLEKLLAEHRAKLGADEALLADLSARKTSAQEKKAHVEHQILQSMSSDAEPQRPEDEPLTPPPVESLTPVGSPKGFTAELVSSPPPPLPPLAAADHQVPLAAGGGAAARAVDDALHQVPVARSPVNGEGPLSKKRRVGSQMVNDEEAAFASSMMGDLDDDVAAMLDAN